MTTLKDYIEIDHKLFESIDPKSVRTVNPTPLMKWIETTENQPTFEEGLLDQIVYTCQLFIVIKSKQFKRMMKAASYTYFIPKGDTISNKLHSRITIIKTELKILLEQTCSTIALSLDGQTSQNSLPMLAINGTWLGPNFEQY